MNRVSFLTDFLDKQKVGAGEAQLGAYLKHAPMRRNIRSVEDDPRANEIDDNDSHQDHHQLPPERIGKPLLALSLGFEGVNEFFV